MYDKEDIAPRSRKRKALHTVAGRVAVHPIAEAPEGEYFHFAWLLRHEAFLRFDYDPDAAFSEKKDEYGFRE